MYFLRTRKEKKHEFPFKLSLSKVVWGSKNFMSVMQAFIRKKHIKVITYHLHSLRVLKLPTQFLHIKITFGFLRSYTYTFNRVIERTWKVVHMFNRSTAFISLTNQNTNLTKIDINNSMKSKICICGYFWTLNCMNCFLAPSQILSWDKRFFAYVALVWLLSFMNIWCVIL